MYTFSQVLLLLLLLAVVLTYPGMIFVCSRPSLFEVAYSVEVGRITSIIVLFGQACPLSVNAWDRANYNMQGRQFPVFVGMFILAVIRSYLVFYFG